MRVSHCGVCHSDIHLQDGYFDLGGGQKLDVRGNRPLPFTLGHEIAGTVEAAGPEAKGVDARQALRRLSVDRLRQVRAVRARRRAHVQRAPRARRHRRRRLCHARAGAASALSPRRGGHRAGHRRRADVLRPHRLWRHQEGACPTCKRRPAADRRARRRRHDGAAVRPRAHGQADLRRRHRQGQTRGRAEARRGGSLRPGRCRRAQGHRQGIGRRRRRGGRLRRLRQVAGLRPQRRRQGRRGHRRRPVRRQLLHAGADVPAARAHHHGQLRRLDRRGARDAGPRQGRQGGADPGGDARRSARPAARSTICAPARSSAAW